MLKLKLQKLKIRKFHIPDQIRHDWDSFTREKIVMMRLLMN